MPKSKKSSDVASRLYQLCIVRFEKKYLQTSICDRCTNSSSLCLRVTVYTWFTTKTQIHLHQPCQTLTATLAIMLEELNMPHGCKSS